MLSFPRWISVCSSSRSFFCVRPSFNSTSAWNTIWDSSVGTLFYASQSATSSRWATTTTRRSLRWSEGGQSQRCLTRGERKRTWRFIIGDEWARSQSVLVSSPAFYKCRAAIKTLDGLAAGLTCSEAASSILVNWNQARASNESIGCHPPHRVLSHPFSLHLASLICRASLTPLTLRRSSRHYSGSPSLLFHYFRETRLKRAMTLRDIACHASSMSLFRALLIASRLSYSIRVEDDSRCCTFVFIVRKRCWRFGKNNGEMFLGFFALHAFMCKLIRSKTFTICKTALTFDSFTNATNIFTTFEKSYN